MKSFIKKGFTLAEVLITLVIIGVVATMTIPTLIAKINSIVIDNQVKVFNAKLIKGLNLTKTAGDLNDTYTSTYDFLVSGLGKNLKMTKICDASNLRDCVSYDKIKYEKSDGTEDSVNVKDLNPQKLQLDIAFKDLAAFVLADGKPAIVSYNLKCIDDPDKADTELNACLAGIYDLNGTRKPNKFGTKVENDKTVFVGDIRSFNGARVGGASCLSIGGQKACVVKTAKKPQSIWQEYFEELPTYTDSAGNSQPDYWIVAKKYCEVEGGHLPTAAELLTIAQVLYGDTSVRNLRNPLVCGLIHLQALKKPINADLMRTTQTTTKLTEILMPDKQFVWNKKDYTPPIGGG